MSTYNQKIPHLLKSDPNWISRRKELLSREPLCRVCVQLGYQTPATMVDHIIPRSQGGGHDESNLQPICKSCHDAKTGREKRGHVDDRPTVALDGSRTRGAVPLAPRDFGTSARSKFLRRTK